MSVKLNGNKVILKNGKVSCTCCQEEVECNQIVEILGGQTRFRRYEVNVGSSLGTVTMIFEPYEIPDRFMVYFDDELVIDTGYVGTAYEEFAEALSDALGEQVVPTHPGLGETTFSKNSPTTKAIVVVDAPLPGTGWYFIVGCPEGAP